MLVSFILSVIAGLATPMAEPQIAKALKGIMLSELPMKEGEFRTFSFVIMLLLVSLLIALFGWSGHPFVVVLGGGIGLFGKRIFDQFRR